jgi:hypothetical protein
LVAESILITLFGGAAASVRPPAFIRVTGLQTFINHLGG